MLDVQATEKRLLLGRKAALIGLFILLIGGSALIGFGAALQNHLMFINGGAVILASPVFLTIAIALRRKLKKLATKN